MILSYRLVLLCLISIPSHAMDHNKLDNLLDQIFAKEEHQKHITAINSLRSTPRILSYIPCIMPIKHYKAKDNISSYFGARIHPINGFTSFHQGVDILPMNKNDTIYATAHASIDTIAYDSKLGYHIKLKHKYHYYTIYGHLKNVLIKNITKEIQQGEPIAIMGSTGLSTGTHLHYAIIHNGNFVNPSIYMELYKSILIRLNNYE